MGQADGPKIVVNVDSFRYPPIAKQAGIEGEFTFVVTGSGRQLISERSNVEERGKRSILEEPAERNLDTWTLPRLDRGHYQVRYRFVLLREPACEYSTRTFPAEKSISRSGDDVILEVVVKATRQCAQY